MKLLALVAATVSLALVEPAAANRLRWAADTDPGTMDPYTRNVTATHSFLANIYEPLVRRGRDLSLEPSLATSWSQTALDVWRFELRRNVRFHDGSPFSADDVVFSYARARGPGSLIASYLSSVKEIRKIDDFTVEFVTDGPDPILPGNFAVWHIMSKSWSEKNNTVQATNLSRNETSHASNNANGTGPFRLRMRQADSRAELEANPGWWDKPEHNLTEVIFTPIANAAGRAAALLSGEVDMVYTLPLTAVAQVQSRPNLRVHQTPETRTMYFAYDVLRDELLDSDVKGRNPFKDIRVRQAMRMAIDAEALKNVTMRGFATLNFIMAGPGINGFDASINVAPPRDLDRARALMTEAGYPNGFEVRMDCSNDRYVNDEQICLAAVGMLSRIGIRAKLRTAPFSQYVRLVSPPYEMSLAYIGWSASTYDTHNTLLNLLATRAPGSPRGVFNIGGYSNARVDQLTDQIRTELDATKRNAMIREALQIVRDEVATIPIFQQVIVWGAKDNVELVQRADNWFPLRHVRVK
ncbi:MAG: ABC transporter substrate-binding protein [Alphaproteobacteria bacterium]|nr:ABC transporter substrate-binding protein [Alphaproteobacteria bacterium]